MSKEEEREEKRTSQVKAVRQILAQHFPVHDGDNHVDTLSGFRHIVRLTGLPKVTYGKGRIQNIFREGKHGSL
eukprot:gene5288-18534_t